MEEVARLTMKAFLECVYHAVATKTLRGPSDGKVDPSLGARLTKHFVTLGHNIMGPYSQNFLRPIFKLFETLK
jgi:hypothetical protein